MNGFERLGVGFARCAALFLIASILAANLISWWYPAYARMVMEDFFYAAHIPFIVVGVLLTGWMFAFGPQRPIVRFIIAVGCHMTLVAVYEYGVHLSPYSSASSIRDYRADLSFYTVAVFGVAIPGLLLRFFRNVHFDKKINQNACFKNPYPWEEIGIVILYMGLVCGSLYLLNWISGNNNSAPEFDIFNFVGIWLGLILFPSLAATIWFLLWAGSRRIVVASLYHIAIISLVVAPSIAVGLIIANKEPLESIFYLKEFVVIETSLTVLIGLLACAVVVLRGLGYDLCWPKYNVKLREISSTSSGKPHPLD